MRFNHLIVEIQDKIAWISINRPKKLNALNREVLEELNTLFVALNNDAAVHIIILTGTGDKAFIAGADIAEFAAFDALEGEALSRKGQQTVFDQIAETNKPVIAAINGFALGGGLELALSCHVRIASSNAKMGLPETSLGVIPGYGGTQRLPQIIGRGRATELIITGRMMNADEALQTGLVTQVVPQEELLSTAASLAEKIKNNSPHAIAQALGAIASGYVDGTNGYEEEIKRFGTCFGHPEFKEGTQAFLAKRKANF